MNLILAWLLISIGFAINLPTQIDSPSNPPPHAIMSNPQIAVGQIQSGSPAAAAGLQPDDIILKIDGQSYQDIQPAIDYVRKHPGKSLQFEIKRVNQIVGLAITPKVNPDLNGQGYIGVEMANIANLRYPWYYALYEGARATGYQIINVVSGL